MRLVADNLAGERGGEPVFAGVSFSLDEGQALAVTGPNGAGKTTLLRIVAGLLPAAGGSVRLERPLHHASHGPPPPLRRGGYGGEEWPTPQAAAHLLSHQNGMKTALTVEENLRFWRAFLGEPHLEVAEALEMVGLGDIGHLPFGYLSTGQKRRAAIARLLVSYRPLWLLDEPTAGLDAASERQFAALMEAHLEDGGMILAATHLPLGIEGAGELRMGGGA
ncbi:MAG: heme ABC exporter ATP-binding protein CcmA [Rhizobiaceae bacterium]|nr:heme ABC exporter ATP-binding protein CcmA [Rhizobiaceae bacterium]